MCKLKSAGVIIATFFLFAGPFAMSPMLQEPSQHSTHTPSPRRPSDVNQEILELRAKLGGGVSTILSDSGLSKAADQAFTQELERLQKNQNHPEHQAVNPPRDPQILSPERGLRDFPQPQSGLVVPPQSGFSAPSPIGPNVSLIDPPQSSPNFPLQNSHNVPMQSGPNVPSPSGPNVSLQRGPNFPLPRDPSIPPFSQVQNGFNQYPPPISPPSAHHPVNLDRLRHFARSMESLANDMEDAQLYELADRLRSEAQQLRLRARNTNR